MVELSIYRTKDFFLRPKLTSKDGWKTEIKIPARRLMDSTDPAVSRHDVRKLGEVCPL